MESLPRSLNYELPQVALHFGAYAQQLLEQSNGKAVAAGTPTHDIHAVTPTIASGLDAAAAASTSTSSNSLVASEFLQKLGASLLNSIHLQSFHKAESAGSAIPSSAAISSSGHNMDMDYNSHHVVIDSSSFDAMDELQKQLEYDKLMNEVWIGIVLTLILISMVFCICSCFLYHQFRTWKRNYQSTVMQAQNTDVEAMKLSTDMEDPVPEYTLVSGLPSYEAALELLQKTPKSCLLVYPSVFGVFNRNEKTAGESATTATLQEETQQSSVAEVTTPLLSATTSQLAPATTTTTTTAATQLVKALVPGTATLILPTYAEACNTSHNNQSNSSLTAVTLTAVNAKSMQQAQKSAITTTRTTTVHTNHTNTTTSSPATAMTSAAPNVTAAKMSDKTDKC